MRFGTTIAGLVMAALAAPSTAAAVAPVAREAPAVAGVVAGEVIVRFASGTDASERLAARRAADVSLDRALELPRAQLVEADGSVMAAVRRLERQPGVADAQPNYRYRATAVAPPNDPLLDSLWGLEDPAAPDPGVDALAAWETTRGAGQVIAIVDTGVELDHPDLAANLWTGPGGIHGRDFVDDDSDPDDFHVHGTHVAGTAAATDDNAVGIAGVAPDAQIMAVRVLDGNGSGSSADVGDGIAFAAQNGADVINLSLSGSGGSDPFMSSAIAVANQQDAVVVAAAGNESSDNDTAPTVPCTLAHANLICVAAVNRAGALASFSNRGAKTVDVGAPGTSILSAATDYAELLADDFSAPAGWSTATDNGGIAWGPVASPNSDGTAAMADSPGGDYGAAADPGSYAVSTLTRSAPLDLTGQRGCRMHFDLRHQLEQGVDGLVAGARLPDLDADPFLTGSSGGFFSAKEVSISYADGSAAVTPRFTLLSDDSDERDGVYLDRLRVLCRSAPSAGGDYVSFQGTSMAAPHVAGVAALVGAADPTAADTEIVQAIKDGGAPLAALVGNTVSGRTADADGAIAAALGLSPSSPPQEPPSTPRSLPPLAPPLVVAPRTTGITRPAKPDLSRSPATIRVFRSGVFRYRFDATPRLTGRALFRTRRKAVVSRRAHLTIARTYFAVAPSGRASTRVRLTKRQLGILRRNRRLLLRVTVTVETAASMTATATGRLTLKPGLR